MTCPNCDRPIPLGGYWRFHACPCGLVTERGRVEAQPAVGMAPARSEATVAPLVAVPTPEDRRHFMGEPPSWQGRPDPDAARAAGALIVLAVVWTLLAWALAT